MIKEKVLQLNNEIINNEKVIFWSILTAILFCFGFYMFLINSTVHNVVSRQNLESEASALTLKLGNQEFQYITSRNNVTLAMAHTLGFKDVSEKTFISKNSSRQVSFLSR